MLNKSISLSSQVNKLPLKYKLIFTWSIAHLDDWGRITNDPEVFKATVHPMDDDITIKDCDGFMANLLELELAKNLSDCLEYTGFWNHQSITEDKRAKSRFTAIPQESPRIPKNPHPNITKVNITKEKIGGNEKSLLSTNEALNLFNDVNPSYERLFANTTERAAMDRLVKKYGSLKLGKIIEYVKFSNTQPYAPTITTPYQLEKDMAKLVAFYQKEKNKGEKKSKIFF